METLGKTLAEVLPEQKTMLPSLKADDHVPILDADLRYMGVPKRYKSARLTDFGGEITIPGCNSHGLYLTGAAGRGKTHLATAILVAMAPALFRTCGDGGERISAKWITVPELLLELRDSFNSKYDNVSERTVIAKYTAPLFLVLDDLGAEKTSDWTGQSIYTIISRRINDCKQTIITSNFSLTAIHATDPRLASRLGGMEYFRFEGEDRRQK